MSNTIKQGAIFNVEEPKGAERVQYETTAAGAQADAPNSRVSREVEENANQAKEAAEKAALAAQGMGSDMTGEGLTPLNTLQSQAAKTTNAAVAEGQRDVHAVKDTGASYLDQAKSIAGDVYASAQGSTRGQSDTKPEPIGSSTGVSAPGTTTHDTSVSDAFAALQATGASAIGTTQQYLASAQAVIQPHVETARTTLEPHVAGAKAAVQPHVEKAKETAQGYLGMGIGSKASDAVTPPAEFTNGTGIPPGSYTGGETGRSTTGTDVPLSGQDAAASPFRSTAVADDQGKIQSNVA
ncbi:hypothetical protein BV22DRAFT_62695 [Leucogyrophana mollusca]|uniref:Uncharacterized protein n=1 Tax=Leucogyrophana mollusca TaxID=85980 RepID=A0ACB8BWS0_9AGAM|nr:hypothetical protein BV22DRAFT_62695 [Leucogyrophana mollusca]